MVVLITSLSVVSVLVILGVIADKLGVFADSQDRWEHED